MGSHIVPAVVLGLIAIQAVGDPGPSELVARLGAPSMPTAKRPVKHS